MRQAIAALLFMLPAACAAAQELDQKARIPESVNIGVSSREIAIAPDFAGADVTVFGAIDHPDPYLLAIGAYDIVVSLEGPRDFITMRKKRRILGVWVNRGGVTFEAMPES